MQHVVPNCATMRWAVRRLVGKSQGVHLLETTIGNMKRYMRKIWITLLLTLPCLFAYGDDNNCKEVSGGFVTNILNESGMFADGTKFIATTLGTATGDLAGGLGVYILSITQVNNKTVVKVQHHWVTTAGDTIFMAPATATGYPIGPFAGVTAVADDSYVVNIIGGTGRFAGATGQVKNTAVLDAVNGRAVGRYHGFICFKEKNQQ